MNNIINISIFNRYFFTIILFIFYLISSTNSLPAVSVNEYPYLRIETGEHTAIINRISLNQDKTLLLTVSDDKTARLWNLPKGELRGILRVPIGSGLEGALYAGALAPDGKTAIVAGSITNNEGSYSLYLFNTDTLRMKVRLSNLPSEIVHLSYSPDGNRFVGAFGGAKGIIVWDSVTGKRLFEDFNYGLSCNWIAFANDGRMATSSDDGLIRIYDSQNKLINKIKTSGKPFALSFSDNGRQLAVGYKNKIQVDIIDPNIATIQKSMNVTGLTGENFSSVAWIGENLLAAGTASKTDNYIIRRWSQSGVNPIDIAVAKNTITSIAPLNNNTLIYATAEPSWGIVTLNGQSPVQHNSPISDFRNINHLMLSPNGLVVEWRLRPDSKQVARFDISQPDEQLALFIGAPQLNGLTPSITKNVSIPLSRWENNTTPFLRNKPINLERNEYSRSLAITPNYDGFILGTDFYLRWFNAKGQELTKVDIPAPAYGVNISQDGRYLVAALADGAIYWYRLNSGVLASLEEYAAVFLSVDAIRWISWTKEGFFFHSLLGGKDLAGYQLNRGNNKTPEWITFGQLYQSFYSPSLLTKKMIGGSATALQSQLAQAADRIKQLFVAPIPEVELVQYCLIDNIDMSTRGFSRVAIPQSSTITSNSATCFPINNTRAFSRIANNSTQTLISQRDELPSGKKLVRVRFKINKKNGGVGDVQLWLNGRPVVSEMRSFSRVNSETSTVAASLNPNNLTKNKEEEILEQDLTLNTNDNQIQVRVYDARNSAYAKSGIVELFIPPVLSTPQPQSTVTKTTPEPKQLIEQPSLYILSVGIDKYIGGPPPLNFAVKDAKSVTEVLRANHSEDYNKVSVIGLYDEQATKSEILKAFDNILRKVNKLDTVIIYLSGHGDIGKEGEGPKYTGKYFYIPFGSQSREEDFSDDLLSENITKLFNKVKYVIILLDTCHSGASQGTIAIKDPIDKLQDRSGVIMISAAHSTQTAADEYRKQNGSSWISLGNGVFAYVIMEGLKGFDQSAESKVDLYHLIRAIGKQSDIIRKENPTDYSQLPVSRVSDNMMMFLEDIPLTVIKK